MTNTQFERLMSKLNAVLTELIRLNGGHADPVGAEGARGTYEFTPDAGGLDGPAATQGTTDDANVVAQRNEPPQPAPRTLADAMCPPRAKRGRKRGRP